MESNNGTEATAGIESLLSETMAPLREARERLLGMETKMTAELKTIRAERVKVERVLKVIDPEALTPSKPTRTRRASGSGNTGYSQDTYDRVWNVLKENPDGMITSDIAAAAGVHKTSVAKVLKVLREHERVRNAGRVRHEGQVGTAPILFKPVLGAAE